MCCNQGFKNIICNEKVASEYLYYLLGYNTIFLNSLGRGATFKEISKKIVEEIKVPLPVKELQNQFAVFTRQVDKSKFVAKQ
ncbi:restriction endonuclease subunit S [Candidatus Minimicrobia vallesae]|uniref:Restriction endonuclease subunit S n=1 Tax=Candidatus Minimicrobia vallesae TaxID=2841264 RepID=A0A8F1MAI3_9BACT|nr:restriction endonuclease subunit S [Candidatus Minimicrobia vallesae]